MSVYPRVCGVDEQDVARELELGVYPRVCGVDLVSLPPL